MPAMPSTYASGTDCVAAIDLGTTKVVVIIGRKASDGKLKVIACSETPSQGIRRGEVLNIREVEEAVQVTLRDIRSRTQIDFKDVYVGIAGQHIRCFDSRVNNLRPDGDAEISEHEIRELEEQMYRMHVEPGEKILHVIPQSYNVDDYLGITRPVGMPGKQLEANYRIFVGKLRSADYINRCIKQAGLSLKQLILEPIASAQAVLSADEKEIGVAMVDIGGGTTDLVIYYDNIIRHSAVIPFGGNVISEDVRHGCGLLPRQANAVKEQYGSCFSEMVDDTLLIIEGVNQQEREISFKFLAEIIEARMDEIMDAVMYEIDQSGYGDKIHAGIVFTGGGAMMQHLVPFVNNKTGLPARVAKPMNLTDDSPAEVRQCSYATAVGLLLKGMAHEAALVLPQQMPPVAIEQPASVPVDAPPPTKPGKTPKTPRTPHQPATKKFLNGLFDEWFRQNDNAV
jgi:cell division protein FtsA